MAKTTPKATKTTKTDTAATKPQAATWGKCPDCGRELEPFHTTINFAARTRTFYLRCTDLAGCSYRAAKVEDRRPEPTANTIEGGAARSAVARMRRQRFAV